MKPDWKDAPEWANWLAMDPNGSWYWFENEPFSDDGEWIPLHYGEVSRAGVCDVNWEETKEAKPQ